MPKSLSVVLPVFNEEEILEETTCIFLQDLSRLQSDYEIIIVDDGSSDQTGKIADSLAEKIGCLKVIHNPKNLGSGKSLYLGFKEARGELLIGNFADRPFDLKELRNILPLFDDQNTDFVVVARTDRSANTFYRKLTSLLNYWLIRLLFRVRVSDFQFAQIYKKEIIETISIMSTQTFVPPELIIKALYNGFKMIEYRSKFYPREKGNAKCGKPKVIFKTLHDIFRFWCKWIVLRKRDI
jgi:glycosyltransferase involved in cell wall biosynthesis